MRNGNVKRGKRARNRKKKKKKCKNILFRRILLVLFMIFAFGIIIIS